jgi:hypothetical protein
MNPGWVCRHLKIAGLVTISRFFHVTTHHPAPLKLQHIPFKLGESKDEHGATVFIPDAMFCIVLDV